VLARLLLFAGLIVVVGAVVLSAYAFGAPPPALRRVIAAGAGAAFAGTIAVVAAEAMGAGVGLTGALASSLGRSLIARAAVAILLLAASLVLLTRPGRHVASLSLLAGAAGLAGMAVDVLNSHAAAEGPMTINELVQWLHITAVGVWIGGLVALLVGLRQQPTDSQTYLTRRLSRLAGFFLVVVVATGVFRAVIEVQTWGNLVSTAFGLLVLLKVVLLLTLAGLGAFNRYGNVPHLPRTLARLRRIVSTEALVALGAVTVAAALVNVAPPAEYAAAAASARATSLVITGSDYATTVKVRLVVNPGAAGFNTFDLRVADYTSGNELRASKAILQFTQPLRPTLGMSTLVLDRQRDGTFLARGGNLSLSGIWEVAAIIENGAESVEVHLQLITIAPPPAIRVSHFGGGLPTVYTIQLASNMQAQVYLDPNKPGVGEFHVTFLSSAGAEVPIAQATTGMTVPGGMPTILVTRRLDEIGHFVSDATVPAGGARFDILATTVAGQSIATYIVITPGS
jgi:putative copper export protein